MGLYSRRHFLPIALEEGKAPFVNEEIEAQIIEINLLQLLGIQRQTGKEPEIGDKGYGGKKEVEAPTCCHSPCNSGLGPRSANIKVPQKPAGSQDSGLSGIPPTFHFGVNLRDPGEPSALAVVLQAGSH